MVTPLTIDELCTRAYDNAEAKSFHPPVPADPNTLEEAIQQLQETRRELQIARFFQRLFLVISEIVEAGEAWRKGAPTDANTSAPGEKPEGIPSEMGDVFIRLGDTCREYNIPIVSAIVEKMAYNATRPWMHGGKLA